LANEALSFVGVDAFYGDSHILHNVSFSLAEGTLLGLLGRNGAGKTTCMNVAVGFLAPRAGRLNVFGTNINGRSPEWIADHGVALVPQGRRIFRNLSVRENLHVAAHDLKWSGLDGEWTIETVYDTFPRLRERQRQTAGLLSGGEQQMLAIGRALMRNPRVLLLDEPSEGLAPQTIAEVMKTVRLLKGKGLSIILIEQNAELVFDVADDVVVLNSGQVAMNGGPTELKNSPADMQRHLGVF
jgi:branched-chain amino acid transport system ATP-binding protein